MNITARHHILAFMLITFLGLGAYANSFNAGFHFDDYTYIVNKKEIRDLYDVRAIYQALGHPSRFVAFFSFAVNYHFHRFDVFGYHLVNWLIHLANSGLVYWLVLLLARTPRFDEKNIASGIFPLALFSALLFLAHPLQTEAVTYIVQRFTSLAAFFFLCAVCFYLKGRGTAGPRQALCYAGFCAATILGMFTKQICFTIPVIIVWMEWLFFPSGVVTLIRKRWPWLVILFLFLLLIPSFFGFDPSGIIGREFPSRSHTADIINTQTYFLTQSRVIPTYIRLLFFPVNQTLDYDFPVSRSMSEPKVILGFLFLAMLLFLTGWLVQRQRLIAFGIGWFFITLSVTSTIIPIPHVIFEHHVYLPAVGFVIVFNLLVLAIVKRTKPYMVLMSGVVLLFGVLTYQRNEVWRTDLNLWTDIVKKTPKKVRVWNNLGMAYLEMKEYEKSISCFDQALSMGEGEARVYNNRGLAYAGLNRDEEAIADFSRAIQIYRQNKNLVPDFSKAVWAEIFNNRGNLHIKHQRYPQAQKDLEAGLGIDPNNERILYNLGYVHELTRRPAQAKEFYERALKANAEFIKPYIGLGFVHHEEGNNDLALEYYDRALAVNPQDGEACFHRAVVLYELGRKEDAQADMRKSVEYGFEARNEALSAARTKILKMD